jgi:spermidine synthase
MRINKPTIVTISEWDGVRSLHLDSPWVQGSMAIKDPFALELDYVQRMMAWLLFVPLSSVKDRQAMQLGLGAASITKFCYKALGMQTTAIEINPAVVAVCRQWFKLPPDNPRLNIVLADAGQAIKQHHWFGTIDALAIDLYDQDAAAPVMDSLEFYQDCKAVLTDDGLMTVNLFGRHHSYTASLEKIKTAFGANGVRVFKPTREGNTVVIASRCNIATDHQTIQSVLSQRAQAIESRWGLPANKWLKNLSVVA